MSALETATSIEQVGARYRSCNLCGSEERRARYNVDGYHVVDCQVCKLCYVAEHITPGEILDFYGEAYYNGGHDKGYADYVGHRDARKAHYRSLLPRLRRYLGEGSVRSLDIGCAAGFFLEVAQEAGWQAQGIEISPYMSDYARQQRKLDVLTGTLQEVDLPEGAFNLVTMWDVIEHLADPLGALKRSHALLAPSGVIAISTGDISGATAKIHSRRWALLAPPGHLFYFSRKTLYAMLRRAGFEPLGWQSDGAFLINSNQESEGLSGIWSAVYALHHKRLVNTVLRRLKLGSIMTVYARKCGII